MFRRIQLGLWLLTSGFAFCACDNDNLGSSDTLEFGQPGDTSVPNDSSGHPGDDTELNWDSDSTQPSNSDDVCDEVDINIELVPARLMILQDMSGSMSENEHGGESPPSKWSQARAALKNLLRSQKLHLDWGFDTFPGLDDCAVRWSILSDTKPNNKEAIISTMNILFPNGGTPLYLAMKNFTKPSYAPKFLAPDATSYLLVVSDGGDTCGVNGVYDGNNGATPTQLANITKRLLTDFSVKTFAVGFGSGTETAQLNAIASAGGTGRTTYFNAKNGAELETALLNIASSLISCVYDLKEMDETQVDPNSVNFYFDDEVVKMDDKCAKNTGWTWVGDKKTRVEFCKAACDQLKSGAVKTISATFGCPQVVIM